MRQIYAKVTQAGTAASFALGNRDSAVAQKPLSTSSSTSRAVLNPHSLRPYFCIVPLFIQDSLVAVMSTGDFCLKPDETFQDTGGLGKQSPLSPSWIGGASW